jgi:uncharacterized protein (DUF302 family)
MVDELEKGILTFRSRHATDLTVQELVRAAEKNNVRLIQTIDYGEIAREVDVDVNNTAIMLFAMPEQSAALLNCSPTVALDLPQKIVVWEDEEGVAWISYNDPAYTAKRHNVKDCEKEVKETREKLDLLVQQVSTCGAES